MDEHQLRAPERWIDARRAVRAIQARGGWTQSLTASGLRSGVFHLTPDGQAVAMTELLQGVRMVHRLTAGEVAGGFLVLDPDLTVFEAPVAIGVRTTCGEPLSLETVATAGPPTADRPQPTSPRVALGPPDWLDAFTADDLLAVQLMDDTLVVSLVAGAPSHDADDPDLTTVVHETALSQLGTGPLRVAQLLAVLVAVDRVRPDLLDAATDTPIAELLRACGLRQAHGWLTDDDAVDLDRMVGVEQGPGPWVPDGQTPSPLALLVGAIARHRLGVPDPYDGHRRQVVAALDDPDAALLASSASAVSAGVPRLVADLHGQVGGTRRATLLHLSAGHHLAHGRVQAGIDGLQRSVALADRTDARAMLAELRWMCGDHRTAAVLDPSRAESADGLRPGANAWELEELLDVIPSYEDPGDDPVARARQLWRRARWYAQAYGGADLARAQDRRLRQDGPGIAFPPEALADNLLEQFGGLRRFAAEVGPLLPADEQQLLRRWLARRRRWWRIRRFDGRRVELDRLDGGVGTDAIGPWRAEEVEDAPDLLPDELACALVLPTADPGVRILGGPMFCLSRPMASLPPPEDVIGVVARMADGTCSPAGPDQLAA